MGYAHFIPPPPLGARVIPDGGFLVGLAANPRAMAWFAFIRGDESVAGWALPILSRHPHLAPVSFQVVGS